MEIAVGVFRVGGISRVRRAVWYRGCLVVRGSSVVRVSGRLQVLHMPLVDTFICFAFLQSVFWVGGLYIPAYFGGSLIKAWIEVVNLNMKALWIYL